MSNWYLKEISDLSLDENKTKIISSKSTVVILAYLIEQEQICPVCYKSNYSKNGHIMKIIKDASQLRRLIIIKLNIQRYICKECGNSFYEDNPYTNPYELLTKESIVCIMHSLLYDNATYESVAREMHLSRQTIMKVFDRYYEYNKGELPEILSFDEKSNNDRNTKSPYIFIIVDFMKHKIYDILPSRYKISLNKYFSKYSEQVRKKVKYVTMDMWDSYRDVAKCQFKNAIIAVDSFHVMENLNRAMTKIRVSIMQKYNEKTENIIDNSTNYYLLKKYHYFFTKEFDDITDKSIFIPKEHVHLSKHKLLEKLLKIDPRLDKSYKLVSKYREFNKTCRYENAREELEDLIELFANSNEIVFEEFAATLTNWKDEIINSFITVKDHYSDGEEYNRRLSNGLIEGLNSTIARLQMNARGYSNYWRMRNRIIYVVNKDYTLNDDDPKPIAIKNRIKTNKKK